MSLRATLWAYDDAPVTNPTHLLVLIALADEADDRGRNAFPAVKRIAARARVQVRSTQKALRALEAAGLIARGDQSVAARRIRRADRRPTVWDLRLGVTWETAGIPRPTAEDGSEQEFDNGVHEMHPVGDAQEPLDGVHQMHPAAPDGVHQMHPAEGTNPARGVPRDANGVSRGTPNPTKDPTSGYVSQSGTSPIGDVDAADAPPTRPPADPNAGRADVDTLCGALSERLTAVGYRHSITKGWRDAARLMLDRDGRNVDDVLRAIDWAHKHPFWHRQILSMPTLREKYDRLRLDAAAEANGNGRRGTPTNVHRVDPSDADARRRAAFLAPTTTGDR